MRYQGSEAYNVAAAERRREHPERSPRPSFEVVDGGGLDARARAGVSRTFVMRVRAVVAIAAVLVVMGMARVALASATVSVLQTNADLSAQIEEAQTLNSDLRIERSVLSSNSRISRIATQNYGMVLPTESVHVSASEPASTDEASLADGEAAQAANETGAISDVS
ncbi:MAG TPA: cell division protein FtsL [Candidatus Olsenella pullicola]|nr:cell division protein FtsL [Candidatus Olsenella pullicola]